MSILRAAPPTPAVKSLEARIAELRDEIFAVTDTARLALPYEYTSLHVCLQTASNQLGEAERVLRDAARHTVAPART
jgi:hypothetical protein